MRTIPLTQGREAIVDDADYEWISQWKWCFLETLNGNGYAVRSRKRGETPRLIRMHRVILGIVEQPGVVVDHANQDGLDNSRENLRKCDSHQNNQNKRKTTSDKSSIYKGVHWSKQKAAWLACIVVNGKKKTIGHYLLEKDAALAYNKAAETYFGDFACVN